MLVVLCKNSKKITNTRDGSLCFVADNGCEVIAVYNALQLMDKGVSMANLIKKFEENGVVVANELLMGYFGSNPYGIGRVLEDVGVKYNTVSYDGLNAKGLYIISFWDDLNYDSMLHTVAMQSDGKGNYRPYNLYGDGSVANYSLNEITKKSLYIMGYRIMEFSNESFNSNIYKV